jgi:acetyl-CoA acetyltransferase
VNRRIVSVLALGVLLWVPAVAFAQEDSAARAADAVQASNNLSAGRSFGLGIQAEFPWGGLISLRYWATDALGLEGVFFVLANDGETSGIVTARALYRAVDAEAVDFYIAGGASFQLSTYASPALGSLVGGIEINFSQRFAWNVEFGLSATIYGEVWTTFGTGIHFYF